MVPEARLAGFDPAGVLLLLHMHVVAVLPWHAQVRVVPLLGGRDYNLWLQLVEPPEIMAVDHIQTV